MEIRPKGNLQAGAGGRQQQVTGGIHTVPSRLWEQLVSKCRAVNLTQREGRREVMSLGGVCWPVESQKEMQVPRAGCLAAGRKARRAGHLTAWFEGSQEGGHSLTQQTSTRQQLGTKCYFTFSRQPLVPTSGMPLELLSVGAKVSLGSLLARSTPSGL